MRCCVALYANFTRGLATTVPTTSALLLLMQLCSFARVALPQLTALDAAFAVELPGQGWQTYLGSKSKGWLHRDESEHSRHVIDAAR